MEYLLFVILGCVTGLVAGILGVGGGLIIVPGLAMIFKYYYGFDNLYMHLAAGTSLAVMIFTATAGTISNQKQKRIVWAIFFQTIPWILFADIVGAFISGLLNAITLSILFAVIILIMAAKMIVTVVKIKKNIKDDEIIKKVPLYLAAMVGSLIGLKSGLFGIGGGAISVPYMTSVGVPMKKATGTSMAFTLPISLVGTLCFIIIGLVAKVNISNTLGYVYWPTVLVIAPCTMFFAPIGSKLAAGMSTKWLRYIFIIFLLFIGFKMLITALI